MSYILSIDQSTQGTKALLFDQNGQIIKRNDKAHKQIINELGYVSHDPEEIYRNTITVVKELFADIDVNLDDVKALGISNQRETTVMWDKSGKPLADAIVWQCNRASEICKRYESYKDKIYEITGLVLSPYFPASKMRWLIENINPSDDYMLGTIDSWLIYKLTNGKSFKTDASNASRTQVFDIHTGEWSEELCELFEIDINRLPEICNSNDCFGTTDFEGLFEKPIPILAVMGDSHAALYGQGCHSSGDVKITLGTGSSIMMNIGKEYKKSKNGLTTSLAWKLDNEMTYVFEGNINYAGAVITWLQKDLGLINNPSEIEDIVSLANPEDETVLVPAFSGLSAPYWDDNVKAMFYGMSRTTTKNELVKASLESIAYQITDILNAMASDSSLSLNKVKTDGGPSKNVYLMQFLSDMARCSVLASNKEELSAIGVGYLAGITAHIYTKDIVNNNEYRTYNSVMDTTIWKKTMARWHDAIKILIRR